MGLKIIIILFILIIIISILCNIIYKYVYNAEIDLSKFQFENYGNKKICICMSGQIRENYYQTLLSYKIFMIDPLNADIFCIFSDDVNDSIKQEVVNLLKPTNIKWIKDNNVTTKHSMFNINAMFKKIHLCNKFKNDYLTTHNTEYDVCIRARPDIYIKQCIPKKYIDNMAKNTFYTPYSGKFDLPMHAWARGVTDHFWLCDGNTMDTICNMYNKINNDDKCFIPEIALSKYILAKNINIEYLNGFEHPINKMCKKNANIIDYIMNTFDIYYPLQFIKCNMMIK